MSVVKAFLEFKEYHCAIMYILHFSARQIAIKMEDFALFEILLGRSERPWGGLV